MSNYSGSGINYFAITIFIAILLLVGLERFGGLLIVQPVTTALYIWMVILASVALLLGTVNVLWVHLDRIQNGAPEWLHSLALIATLLIVTLAGLLDTSGIDYPLVQWAFDHIIAPVQATLFALLAFFMVAAAYRFLRIGQTGGAWILLGALLIWVVQTPSMNGFIETLFGGDQLIIWLLEQPVMAVLRGVIMGSTVALLLIAIRLIARQR